MTSFKILLESYIINNGKTTPHFLLIRGDCQEDPISAYLIIIVMEVLFTLIKNNQKKSRIRYTQLSFSLFSLR